MAPIDKVILKPLSKVTKKLGEDVKQSLIDKDRVATGETKRNVRSVQKTDSAQLVAPSYIADLEFGKKKGELPTEAKITKWCEARGISLSRVDGIRAKIYLRGYKGRKGVLTDPLSETNINDSLNDELKNVAILVSSEVAKLIK